MNKKITELAILFFFLITLTNAEAGWLKSQLSWPEFSTDIEQDNSGYPEDLPTDAEEDTTETREVDEYESSGFLSQSPYNQLLNLNYSHQRLLFKEHFRESLVPPPKA